MWSTISLILQNQKYFFIDTQGETFYYTTGRSQLTAGCHPTDDFHKRLQKIPLLETEAHKLEVKLKANTKLTSTYKAAKKQESSAFSRTEDIFLRAFPLIGRESNCLLPTYLMHHFGIIWISVLHSTYLSLT